MYFDTEEFEKLQQNNLPTLDGLSMTPECFTFKVILEVSSQCCLLLEYKNYYWEIKALFLSPMISDASKDLKKFRKLLDFLNKLKYRDLRTQ